MFKKVTVGLLSLPLPQLKLNMFADELNLIKERVFKEFWKIFHEWLQRATHV